MCRFVHVYINTDKYFKGKNDCELLTNNNNNNSNINNINNNDDYKKLRRRHRLIILTGCQFKQIVFFFGFMRITLKLIFQCPVHHKILK